MKINWIVRIKNKSFWTFIIPSILLLIQSVCNVFGYSLEFGDLGNKLLVVVECIFSILAFLGIVVDPTTKGIKDSDQAMMYSLPKEDKS